ncbi:hypothetical protein PspLS_09760 [Pyricularia sp. CBS 133598]|nr:hypothetical protein PspLS_09760 [Pyricularia sp. CBS 133598]
MSRYAAAYANPKGPEDARPTALQVVEDEGLIGKLAGKVVLITGANTGIGLETARAIHATGATLFVTARDSKKAQEAVNDIKNHSPGSDAPIYPIELRLDSLASVRAAAEAIQSQSDKLNVLICNAGVMATPLGKTEDGVETQFATNHLGHFLLFQLLKPVLLTSSTPEFQSRVVALSSMAHHRTTVHLDDINYEKGGYNPWESYGRSKTANVLFTNQVERRYGAKGLHGLSVHPGLILTNILQHCDMQEFQQMISSDAAQALIATPGQGAATPTYAAVGAEWEGLGGKYLADLADKTNTGDMTGPAAWTKDEQLQKDLWEKSNQLVGFEE